MQIIDVEKPPPCEVLPDSVPRNSHGLAAFEDIGKPVTGCLLASQAEHEIVFCHMRAQLAHHGETPGNFFVRFRRFDVHTPEG
ncbi:MAG: hypothetical protein AB1451_15040 [Nitrospirota bacterium]